MKAFAIVIGGHKISEKGYSVLKESSKKVGNDFNVMKFSAFTETDASEFMEDQNLKWNWPWSGRDHDHETGLIKQAYGTKVRERRIACALSHYNLWNMCVETEEDFIILEHDAIFQEKLPIGLLSKSEYGVIGLNDPAGATRLPGVFDKVVKHATEPLIPVPRIDKETTAQGLAGNSAYYMKPWAAKQVIASVKKYGLWPNDAMMCYQMFDFLGVTSRYYTRVQGLPSTTTR